MPAAREHRSCRRCGEPNNGSHCAMCTFGVLLPAIVGTFDKGLFYSVGVEFGFSNSKKITIQINTNHSIIPQYNSEVPD